MKLLQKILLAHDFSKSSEQVVATAITLAKVFHAKIIPIHVLPDDNLNEKVKLLLHETATQKLEQTADRIKQEGIEVGKPLLKYGSPYENIVNAAQNERVNLIVIGPGETIEKENFQLGTTAHRVIQGSDNPYS